MIALAIDPGVTTGYAILSEEGTVLETGNLLPEDVSKALAATISRRLRQGHHVYAVVELFPVAPSGDLANTLREVVRAIDEVLHDYVLDATRVLPGVWKTSSVPKAPTKIKGDRLSQHQQDAIRMGLWYLAKEHGLRFTRR